MTNNQNFSLEYQVKPILKWAGGKTSVIAQLIKHFPTEFNRYVEPFLGGAAIFLSLSPRIPSIINDSNKEIIHLYKIIRDEPTKLISILDLYSKKYSNAFYYNLRANKPSCDIEKAARTIFLNKTCFNGLFRENKNGEFNVPFGKRLKCPSLYNYANIIKVSNKLKTAKIFNEDFESIFSMVAEGDFVYCDPPYEPLSATSSFNHYNSTGFSQINQKKLLKLALQASKKGAFVAISNSAAPFILELYKNLEIHKIYAKRAINSNGSKRGAIEEILSIIKPNTNPI